MAGTSVVTHSTALKYPLQLSTRMAHPCTLKCHHGGTCTLGKPLHGYQTEELEDELSAVGRGHKTVFMHCVCPRGFTGLQCEIKLVECPSSGFCWDDKKCRMSEDDAGHPFSHCECDGVESDLSQPYARHFCGQTSRTPCWTVSGQSFCQNGGRCRTGTHDSSPGCECTLDWEGPHCEFIKGTHYNQPPEKDDKVAFALYGFAIALLIVAVVLVVAFAQKRRMSKSTELDAGVAKMEEKDGLVRSVAQDFERHQQDNDEEESYESDDDDDSDDGSESSGDEYESDDLELQVKSSHVHGDPKGPAVL